MSTTLLSTPIETPSRPIFIFCHPRTTSNLLVKIFSEHPSLAFKTYPFSNAFMFSNERLMCRMTPAIDEMYTKNKTHEEREAVSYANCFQDILESLEEAKSAGKIAVIKDHIFYVGDPTVVARNLPGYKRPIRSRPSLLPYLDNSQPSTSGNPTILTDEFLQGFSPIFMIRNPYYMIPSYTKAAITAYGISVLDEDYPVNVSFRWSRLLFDFYKQYYKAHPELAPNGDADNWPIVVESEDLLYDAENVAEKVCKLVGLDPQYLQYSWEPSKVAHLETDPSFEIFVGDMMRSTGVIKKEGDRVEVVPEVEVEKWVKIYGKENAEVMAKHAKETMEDYEYLLQHRLR